MTTTTTPRAELIPAQGERRPIEPANGTDFTLEELQAYVGGYIEVRNLRNGRILVMNEDGKAQRLPVNEAATMMDLELAASDAIVGDVVLCDTNLLQ